ncbi:MAG: sigma-70 family RNA polymerase sigma factor [Chloroflexota bacterium]
MTTKFVAVNSDNKIVYSIEAETNAAAELKFAEIEIIKGMSFQVFEAGEITPPTDRQIWAIIFRLNKQLRAIAGALLEQAKTYEFDDILQEMRIALYKRACGDPCFIYSLDAYILNQAAWAGKHFCESDRFYDKTNVIFDDKEDAEEDAPDFFELQPDESASPEERTEDREFAQTIAEIVSELPKYQQKIVQMLAEGYAQKEIAAELKLLPSAISMAKKAIRQAVEKGLQMRDSFIADAPLQLTMFN